jgi:urocanate hydratase
VNTANLSVSGSGAIIIDEMDAILLTDVDTANGAITVTAGGAITATDIASLTDNDSNDISITGNGIAATLINAGATGDITLNAGTGAISQDGTDDKDDVIADVLTADSATGIDLDATISSANLTVTGTGSIMLDEQDAVVLADVDTANGAISVTAGGAITATDLASTTDSDANDVSLTGNNIAVTLINAGTLGDVTLNAGTGAVTQDGTDDKDDVTADVLTADAATGINLDTTAGSSDLSVTGTCPIWILLMVPSRSPPRVP